MNVSLTGYSYSTLSHSPSEIAAKFMFFVQDVGWYVCKPDYKIERSLSHYQIKYVLRGSGYLELDGKTYKLNPKELFLLDLSHKHKYYADPEDPWELLWVRFGGLQVPYYFELLDAAEHPVLQTGNADLMLALFRQLYEIFQFRPPGLEFMASSLITQIFTELLVTLLDTNKHEPMSLDNVYPEEIRLALEYIEAHYHTDIKVEDVANFVHLSPYYLSRLFKRYTCHTIMEYVIKYRIIISKQLLTSTPMPISEIAQHVGMCHQSYFSMLFKKYEGVSPNQYRKYIRLSKLPAP
ncbi:AraC family transcriptional regulator [Paenibacillus sp. SAF-054]|uniref:AraC family transcriptional regulator n=1 Tax=unclassified Paenibacillus TaxID=185978 RepID=UPI003F7E0EF5